MALIDKLVKKGVYQFIGDVEIDYHAGVFFVYKKTSYFQFYSNSIIKYYTRIEGQRPTDTDYLKLYEHIKNDGEGVQISKLEIIDWNKNINAFSLKINEQQRYFYIMPSKLTELITDTITEFVIDSRDEGSRITNVFRLIEI